MGTYYQVRATVEGRERRYDVPDVADALVLGATIRRYFPDVQPTVVEIRRTRATTAPAGAGR